jgi:Yip1 domain
MALVDRVKSILLTPKTEWEVIDAEPTTVADLYKGYIIPLAAIGPVAQAIGSSVFGYTLPFVGSYRTPPGAAIIGAIVSYILTLVGVYVLALIIDALAPTFNGTRNQIQALKVAAYSYTASWVVGIFALIPGLSFLMILGVYSLYLMYLGLPVLMKSPKEKALGYTVVVILAGIVLFMAIALVAGMFVAAPGAFGR